MGNSSPSTSGRTKTSGIGQVFSKFVFSGEEVRTCGTGTLICHEDSDKLFVLTCANNVVLYDTWNDKLETAVFAEFHKYNPVTNKKEVILVTKIDIHPNYKKNQDIFEDNFALLLLEKKRTEEIKTSKDSCWDFYKAEDSSRSLKVKGFPAEQQNIENDAYEMTGTDHSLAREGKIITYKDIRTVPGQSGSPIFVHNPQARGNSNEWRIIGVHVGDDNIEKRNVGAVITKEKFDWIVSLF